jgi:hypothetical protein
MKGLAGRETTNRWRPRGSHLRLLGLGLLAVLTPALGTLIYTIYHADSILQTRIIETLSSRFQAPVELTGFHASVAHGVQVSGWGLKIFGRNDLNIHQPGIQPLISVGEFRFTAGILNLLRTPMRVHRVYLKELELNIPPKGQDGDRIIMRKRKIKIYVDEFLCEDARLIINTPKPDKLPLEFDVSHLDMREIGPGQPLYFKATLVNPKPVGDIDSDGLFGPWQTDDPRATPVRGKYSFSNANLGTIRGIGGILSSTGQYEGTLGNITVDGRTETPDFQIAISGHPVPLRTEFHAIVDGTSGDTYLEPVKAMILHSSVVAKGSVLRVKNPQGHRILLDVVVGRARIEDLLTLGVRTEPPVMTGNAELSTRFDLPAGDADVSNRIRLAGHFRVSEAHLTNDKMQSKLDALSMRSQGRPKEARRDVPDVLSETSGKFALKNGLLFFSRLHFEIPGTEINLTGKYSLDGNQFDFHGKARMNARLSHMVTGWKSVLLKPVDPFLSKDGAGTEIPVKITGTKSEPRFGLDFGH